MTQRSLFDDDAPEVRSDACFSNDRRYRYWLKRQWDSRKPFGAVIGINPSTAGVDDDDHTSRKVTGFARRWGWGGFWMLNPFAYVSTDQRGLLHTADPVGVENDVALSSVLGREEEYDWPATIVIAWGSAKTNAVRRMLDARLGQLRKHGVLNLDDPRVHCLGRTGDGSPRHPLMLAYNTPLEPWASSPARDAFLDTSQSYMGQTPRSWKR